MALTVGQFKKMLSVKRDTDLVSINNMLIEYAEIDMNNKVDMSTNINIWSVGELSKDNIRKARLRAVGVRIK